LKPELLISEAVTQFRFTFRPIGEEVKEDKSTGNGASFLPTVHLEK
jgi:hypothetical protein